MDSKTLGATIAIMKNIPGSAAQRAEAAAEAAEDVLESIPEDYSELSADVGSLKSAIDHIQNKENLFDSSDTSEGRLDTTGKFVSVEGYYTSDYIPVIVGQTYYKNSPLINAYHRICAYASNTSATGRVVSDSNYITIQSGENYVRFCGIDTEAATAELHLVTAVDKVVRDDVRDYSTVKSNVTSLISAVGYGFNRGSDLSTDADSAGDGWTRATTSTSNIPDSKGGFICTVSRAASSKVQLFISNDINHGSEKARLFVRYMQSSTWKSWAELQSNPFEKDVDYSGDLDSFLEGVTRVSASATNNPTEAVGYCIAVKRSTGACMQMFVGDVGSVYTRTSTSSTFSRWSRVCAYKDYFHMAGKTGYTFGDSIMAQDGKLFSTYYTQNAQYNLDKLSETCKGYQAHLRNQYGVTITDYAVGGEGIVNQLTAIKGANYTGIDFVIIAVGVNDYSGGKAMGSLPTSADATLDETTFIGAYCSGVKYIKTQNPDTKILLMTPLQRDTKWRNDGEPDASKSATDIYTQNSQNKYLKDYRDAIISIGEMYSCVVCDMYADGGLNLYNLPAYTFEGVHPTNEGYDYIMPVLYRAFEKL